MFQSGIEKTSSLWSMTSQHKAVRGVQCLNLSFWKFSRKWSKSKRRANPVCLLYSVTACDEACSDMHSSPQKLIAGECTFLLRSFCWTHRRTGGSITCFRCGGRFPRVVRFLRERRHVFQGAFCVYVHDVDEGSLLVISL